MKKNIEMTLKRFLKRKKRITEASLIIFLITGGIAYGERLVIDDTNKPAGGEYNISPEKIHDGVNISVPNVTLNNSGNIVVTSPVVVTNNKVDHQGNGVYAIALDEYSNVTYIDGVEINNNGIVRTNAVIVTPDGETSNVDSNYSANGVLGDVKNNTGVIAGGLNITTGNSSSDSKSISKWSGNGVFGDVVSNTGIIDGKINVSTGDSTSNSTLNSTSKSYSEFNGNGVYGGIRSNTGIINGEVNATTGGSESFGRSALSTIQTFSSGNGVLGNVGSNAGIISGGVNDTTGTAANSNLYTYSNSDSYSTYSGNGVYGNVVSNIGLINGKANNTTGSATSNSTSRSSSSGHSEYNYSGNGALGIGVKSNAGIISGEVNTTTGNSLATTPPLYSYAITTSLYSYASSSIYIYGSGNGIYSTSEGVENNTGIINGKVNLTTGNSTSNVYSGSGLDINWTGNGIVGEIENNKGSITGIIRLVPGFSSSDGGVNTFKDYEVIYLSGNGITKQGTFDSNFKNTGLVAGSESAVAIRSAEYLSGSITNYGIFAGREIIGDGTEAFAHGRPVDMIEEYDQYGELSKVELGEDKYKNYGIEIKFNNNENRTIGGITNGSGGVVDIDGTNYTILNGEIFPTVSGADSYHVVDTDTTYDNYIVNGAGLATGALTVNNAKVDLNNSIVNGYEKAVTLNGESTLTATDTIFNGGGIGKWNDNGTPDNNMDDLLEYTDVIEGDSGNNTLNLSGKSIINGKVDLGEGTDNLAIANTVQINGDLYGGTGKDTLNLGDGTPVTATIDMNGDGKIDKGDDRGILLYHTIKGFEDIKVKGNATLYETAKVEGAETINIEASSSLNLRIDPTKADGEGRIIGHALYGSNAVITTADNTAKGIEYDTDGGAFNIITNGLGIGGVIAMSDDKDNKVTFGAFPYIRTDSIITSAELNDKSDIVVAVGEDLDKVFSPLIPLEPSEPINPVDPVDPIDPVKPDKPNWLGDGHYKKLNLEYKSIVSNGDNINALYPTVNTNDKSEALAGENLLLLLNDTFMANPYGYTSRTSKDSMGLFNEMVLNNPFRANEGNWMVYGGLTFGGDDYDSNYKDYIKRNYYGYDTIGIDINADSNVYGGYALAEYGLSKNTSAGFVLGGANSNTDISNGSKIDGDSVYLGVYTKSEINNFKLIAGLGYQYGNYDTTRVAKNKYQHNKYEEEITTDGFTAYTGLSYDYALNNKWSLEPKFNLAYSRITQDSINEEGILSIEADKESFNYVDTEIGMDLVRKIPLDSGEGKFRLGLSYVYALEGSDVDYVTGRYQGGSDFDILVPERDKGIAKIKASYDVEYKSGIVYSVGGAYLPGENRDEYYAGIGIGFKFNDIGDFIPTGTSNSLNTRQEVKTLTAEEAGTDVKVEKQKTNVVITDNVSGFKLNSSKLTREMGKELDKAALEIQKKELMEVKVTGHTDSTGPDAFNKKLSLKRAESAKSRLSKTLPEVEITTKGVGADQPLESNNTLEGRRKNRRIEIEY